MHARNTIKTLHTAAYVKNKTNENKHLMMAICSKHLQKEVRPLL